MRKGRSAAAVSLPRGCLAEEARAGGSRWKGDCDEEGRAALPVVRTSLSHSPPRDGKNSGGNTIFVHLARQGRVKAMLFYTLGSSLPAQRCCR